MSGVNFEATLRALALLDSAFNSIPYDEAPLAVMSYAEQAWCDLGVLQREVIQMQGKEGGGDQ